MVTAAGTAAVDMTRTRFCDSAGLHALLGAIGARAEGGEVRFVVTSPAVRRTLASIMTIDRVIPVFGRLDEALAAPAWSDLSRPVSGQDIVGHVGEAGL